MNYLLLRIFFRGLAKTIRGEPSPYAMRGHYTLVYLLNSCKCYIHLKKARPKASFALKDDERSLFRPDAQATLTMLR